jgi:hypothetical protein
VIFESVLAKDYISYLRPGRTVGSEGNKGKKKGEGFINLSSFNFTLELKDLGYSVLLNDKLRPVVEYVKFRHHRSGYLHCDILLQMCLNILKILSN